MRSLPSGLPISVWPRQSATCAISSFGNFHCCVFAEMLPVNGNRYAAIGLALLVTLLLGLWVENHLEHARERGDVARHANDVREEQWRTVCLHLPIPEDALCRFDPDQTDPNTERANFDLRAQQEMAEWAFAMFLATLVGVAIASWGLVYIVKTFRASSETLKATRDLAYRQLRAYVGLDRVEVTLNKGGRNPYLFDIRVNICIKNAGNTPAKIQLYQFNFYIAPIQESDRLLARHATPVRQMLLPGSILKASIESSADVDSFFEGEMKASVPNFKLWFGLTYYDHQKRETNEIFYFVAPDYTFKDNTAEFEMRQEADPENRRP